jgi:hypothetical protein
LAGFYRKLRVKMRKIYALPLFQAAVRARCSIVKQANNLTVADKLAAQIIESALAFQK